MSPGEVFGLAVYFGAVYGAFQGCARAFYAGLIPPGDEARWYGLYSITDKVRPSASHTLGIDHSLRIIVKLLPRTTARGSDLRPNRRPSFLVLPPCCDALVYCTYSPRRGPGAGAPGRAQIPSRSRA